MNGATGAMLWHYTPDNIATFKNYGIVANRGVSYCDGKLFLLTLDMTLVSLDPATGISSDASRSGRPSPARTPTTATPRRAPRSAPTTLS